MARPIQDPKPFTPFQLIPPPDDAPQPASGGSYAKYKQEPDARDRMVVVWDHKNPEAWSAELDPRFLCVGIGQPCPWLCHEWLPVRWEAGIYPLGRHPRQISEWLSFAIEICERERSEHDLQEEADCRSPHRPEKNNWTGWHVMVRAARLLAKELQADTATLCATPIPTNREDVLAEMEAHQDAIITTLYPTTYSSHPEEPHLTKADADILEYLREKHPILAIQSDLEAAVRCARKQIGERLAILRDRDLTHRPEGPNKGEGLTKKGMTLADRLKAKTPTQN